MRRREAPPGPAAEGEADLAASALWFTGRREAALLPEPVAPPGPREVLVRAAFSAVSRGTEMLVYRGGVPPGTALDLPTLAGGFGFPIKYGYAVAGRVERVGDGVRGLRPGDGVFVLHPHQDVFVVPEGLAVPIPDGVPLLHAALCASAETAVGVVHDAAPRLGETALVFGGGVIGLLAARLLGLAGAGEVLLADPLPSRRELALARGVDGAFPPDEGLPEAVRGATCGRGADVVVEASGSGAALALALECAATEGTVVAASWYGDPVTLPLGGRFHRGRLRLRSSQVGRIAPELAPRWDARRRMGAVLDLLPRLGVADLISDRVPFREAPDLYRAMDRGDGEHLGVVFEYPDGRRE